MSAAPPLDRPAPTPSSEASGSRGLRLGAIFASAVLAAMLASVPAALRILRQSAAHSMPISALPWHLLALVALATPGCVVSMWVLTQARRGLRLIAGDQSVLAMAGLAWWLVVELGILSLAAAVLRKVTHHHALAGVAFAVFALGSGAFFGLLAWRTTARVGRAGRGFSMAAFGLATASLALGVMISGLRLSRTESATPLTVTLLDAVALAISVLFASPKWIGRLRFLAIVGLPTAALVILVGLTALRFDPELERAVSHAAPLHGLVADLFHLSAPAAP
jgi:hypothetical protein